MGLPRYLKEKEKELSNNIETEELLYWAGVLAGCQECGPTGEYASQHLMKYVENNRFVEFVNKSQTEEHDIDDICFESDVDWQIVMEDLAMSHESFFKSKNKKKSIIRWLVKLQISIEKDYGNDKFFYKESIKGEVIEIHVNINPYWDIERNVWCNETRTVTLPEWTLRAKIREIYERKFNKDLNKAKKEKELHERIREFSSRVYASRNFPSSLRVLIFERDNYTCKICGRHKDSLIEDGLHLEVDHIIEYEDGGETTYNNGQTVCSCCNKGKHHAKKKIIALNTLSKAV